MNTKSRLFSAASIVAVASTAASPVLANGTPSGTQVQNQVSVSYTVGTTPQTASTASDTFVVDRRVILTVSELGGSATTVAPHQQDAVTTFQLTNSSNDTLDFLVTATNQSGGAGKFGGTDAFDVADLQIYRETNNTPGLQTGSGGDTLLTGYVDELLPTSTTVPTQGITTLYVVGDVPQNQANATKSVVRLTATAAQGGSANQQGNALSNDNTAVNVAGTVQNVFADDGNLAVGAAGRHDGISFDQDDYLVGAALITAAKSSRLLWDPINGTNNPKMIPGAVIEYCIAVANGTGAATATGINLSDSIPFATTYLPNGTVASGTGVADNTGVGILVDTTGTVTPASGTTPASATCTGGTLDRASDGTPDGTFTAGNGTTVKDVVAGPLSDIAAGVTRGLRFRVVVK